MSKRASATLALLLSLAASAAPAQEYLNGIEWQEPPVVTPGEKCGEAPSDAVILFDGKDLSAWKGAETWKVQDGAMVVGKQMIESKQAFGDSQLHIEWSAPTPPVGESQGRGNSGVFFGPYELQVLDSYKAKTYFDGQAAAIYKQTPPMANAMKAPGDWNTYDVIWTAPRFKDDGSLESPAYITVLHNGVVAQNHFQLLGNTPFNEPPKYVKHDVKQPIRLQDHGNPVRFRNIWIRETKPAEGKQVKEPFIRNGDKETPVKKAS
ncbi:3-keto-disaccharide hydrolase [Lacipirellula sp.]|uniref:3-keto-disaccharide hydrolase n=1 Tax=Lacipirellula sp. TaxID=2691419 RepID=UPI003D0E7978